VDELLAPQPSRKMRKTSEQGSATTSRRLIVVLGSQRMALIANRRANFLPTMRIPIVMTNFGHFWL
jgi:hypothetical protein